MLVQRKHTLAVEGVGEFTFARRTPRLQILVESTRDRMTGGPVLNVALHNTAQAVAELEVLTLAAPEGWDIEAIDPLDDADFGRVLKVHGRLLEAEATFRSGATS